MEPEGSLLHSQAPATCPNPQSEQSTPFRTVSLRSILILSSHLYAGILSFKISSYDMASVLVSEENRDITYFDSYNIYFVIIIIIIIIIIWFSV
jgi:hypothetical protein